MSNTNSAIKHTRTLQEMTESRVILFGNPSDPEIASSILKMKKQGREVYTKPRANWDTGLGKCGQHLCRCKTVCLEHYSKDQTV